MSSETPITPTQLLLESLNSYILTTNKGLAQRNAEKNESWAFKMYAHTPWGERVHVGQAGEFNDYMIVLTGEHDGGKQRSVIIAAASVQFDVEFYEKTNEETTIGFQGHPSGKNPVVVNAAGTDPKK